MGVVHNFHLVEVGRSSVGGSRGMDIQVTEWFNVNNKFSDGEKMGM